MKYIVNKIIFKFCIISFLAISNSSLQAQTIELEFPKFAGKSYFYWLMQGNQRDTIAAGTLDNSGKTILKIPEKYKGYKGMSQWTLVEGGGLEIIINGKNLFVSSTETEPNPNNIKFKGEGAKENEFLKIQDQKQETIFQKIDVLQRVNQLYNKKEAIYSIAKKDLQEQEKQFKDLQIEIRSSALYAAQFLEISNFLRGIGKEIYLSEDKKDIALLSFLIYEMDLEALYTSSHWKNVLKKWIDFNVNFVKDDSKLMAETKVMLARANSAAVYNDLAKSIVADFAQNGKDVLLNDLGLLLQQQGRITNPTGILKRLMQAKVIQDAPALVGLKDQITKGKQTLLLFYQSGCGSCNEELKNLKKNYNLLKQREIRVISISSDENKEIYEYSIVDFPWKDFLWDIKMMDGENFQNYGVIGTPTYILIDEKGKITGRYSKLTDSELLF